MVRPTALTLHSDMSERQKTPQERYAAKYRKQYNLSCFVHTEQDIIQKLDSMGNKSGYIKFLIRQDLAARPGGTSDDEVTSDDQ